VKPLNFSKSVAHAMARDVQQARWDALERLDPEEAYFLLQLYDSLIDVGDVSWLASLSDRYERGQHHLGKHVGIDDPVEEQEVANEMAEDLRELKRLRLETMREPLTEEGLKKAEELLRRAGVELKLLDRGQVPQDVWQN
jgi:hypothetical protein